MSVSMVWVEKADGTREQIVQPFADADTPERVLQQLAGAASMCWEPRPSTEVFDPELAQTYVTCALKRLEELQRTGIRLR